MTAAEVTRAVVRWRWSYREYVCVPRCHFAGSEADLLVLYPSGYMDEVEIKVSASDFKREFKTKEDKHRLLNMGRPLWRWETDELAGFDAENPLHEPTFSDGNRLISYLDWSRPEPHLIRRFWFAAPEELADRIVADVPGHAGLLSVRPRGGVDELIKAPNLKQSRKLTDEERIALMRLAYLRFWDVEARELEVETASAGEVTDHVG